MDENIPKYLYHYTNINTLALILKNRTIKFSALNTVDDIEESQTSDLGEFGKYCFVSCFTELEEESIPFWNMYTDKSTGVRIKLPSNLFKRYAIPSNYSGKDDELTYFNPETYSKNKFVMVLNDKDLLCKINYTDDKSLLYPKVYSVTKESTKFETTNIGKYKRLNWYFQQEWRYLFMVYPFSISDFMRMPSSEIVTELLRKKDLPMNYYYLVIDDIAFENMEVKLGPNTNDGDRIIVETLIKEFNPSCKVTDSVLKGKLRYR